MMHGLHGTFCELEVSLEKFLQVQLTELSPVLEIVCQEYMKSDERRSELFAPLLENVFTLKRCLRCLE